MIGRAARLAGLVTIAALQFYWFQQDTPLQLKILTALFTAVCLASPRAGFVLLALLAPIATRITFLGGGTTPAGLLLEQWVLSASAGGLVWFGARTPTRLGAPALLVAVVAVGSAASMWPTLTAGFAPPGIETGPDIAWEKLWIRRDAANVPGWSAVFAALMVAESCLLGWLVEREVRRMPVLATRMLWALTIGHAAAALFSIEQVVRIASVLGGGLHALPEVFLSARLATEMEVHAAGSIFVLAAIAAAGLCRGSWRQRTAAGSLVALIAIGLWITGSRFAVAGAAFAVMVALVRWAGLASPGRLILAFAASALIAVTIWLALVPGTARFSTLSVSTQNRLMIARASWTLFTTAPAFGIGIDQLYEATGPIVDPRFEELSGYRKQNAHNNFLQVLAELGLVGLAAMLFWLGALLSGFGRAPAESDPHRTALGFGLLVCVGTWLAGHPLLVREFSTAFWMYAAVFAALSSALSPAWLRVTAVLIGAVLVSIPLRAMHLRNEADLEHRGFGLSLWQDGPEGRYREARSEFSLYLPSGATSGLPLRLAPQAPESAEAVFQLGSEVIAKAPLQRDQWRVVEVPIPHRRASYVLVTVRISNARAQPESAVVHVGRPDRR